MDQNELKRKRESAGKVHVGTPDDNSPIRGFVEINDILHTVKDLGIYKVLLADNVDPDRTNPNLPAASTQRVLAYGAKEDFVRQTILTAQKLFNPQYLPKHFDTKKALSLAFEATADLASAKDILNNYQAALDKAIKSHQESPRHDGTLSIPAILDLEPSCNSFIQKIDHARNSLFEIAKLFYGEAIVKGQFTGLKEHALKTYGADDPFTLFMVQQLPCFLFVRNIRNCVEHPKSSEKIVLLDFSLQASNTITGPTIEVIHPETSQAPQGVLQFMISTLDWMSVTFEVMLAYLCGKHVQSISGFQFEVVELPEAQRAKDVPVRFSYGIYNGDQVIPAS